MKQGPRGALVATTILGLWLSCLVALLRLRLAGRDRWLALPLGLLMTFLFTGVFITAHDAIHGTVWPGRRRVNDGFGRVAAAFFALFSFERLREEHWRHHGAPASAGDPDYHDGRHPGFARWYLRFMREYMRPSQLLGMGALLGVFRYALGVPAFNLAAFWAGPALLSSVQLFYFGTYLPHREPAGGYGDDPHRATSNDYPPWLSFLTCYHFGYHHEHHEDPSVPWWRLPRARRAPTPSTSPRRPPPR